MEKYTWYCSFELLKQSHPKAESSGDPYLEKNKLFLSTKPFDTISLVKSDFKCKTYSVEFDNTNSTSIRLLYFNFLTLEDPESYQDILSSWYFSEKKALVIPSDRLFTISSVIEVEDAYGVPLLEDVLEVSTPKKSLSRLSIESESAFHFHEIEEESNNKEIICLQNNDLFMSLYGDKQV
jgi:hypothetical protein